MEEQKPNIEQKPAAEDEIDLIALAKKIWDGRKTIIICTLVGLVLGVFVALTSPKEYTANAVMVPQLGNNSKLGGLGGLAALAGINMDMSQSTELSPLIYPQIVSSVPFKLELMNTPINLSDFKEPVTLFDYYTKHQKKSLLGTVKKYTIGLPFLLIKAIKGEPKETTLPESVVNGPITLNKDQYNVKKVLDGIISLGVNSKDGYLTLTANMPEALASAQIANKGIELLQKYITNFKIEKAKENLDFIQGRYNETKAEFEKAQLSLAVVNDRNKDFTSGVPKIEIDRIQTRYTISYSVFQELAKQLEQAKIQVKKETPVFTIVEPVTVPTEKTKPKKMTILMIWVFLGGVIGVGLVFGKSFLIDLKKKWANI